MPWGKINYHLSLSLFGHCLLLQQEDNSSLDTYLSLVVASDSSTVKLPLISPSCIMGDRAKLGEI